MSRLGVKSIQLPIQRVPEASFCGLKWVEHADESNHITSASVFKV